MTSVQDTPEVDSQSRHREIVATNLTAARGQLVASIAHLERAIASACYLVPTVELLRQLHLVRTQAQCADLWAASAESHIPAKEKTP